MNPKNIVIVRSEKMALLAYVEPDNKGKSIFYRPRQIFLAKNEISWKRESLGSEYCRSDYNNEFIQHGKVKNTEENVILGLAVCLAAKLGNWWPVTVIKTYNKNHYSYYNPHRFSSTVLQTIHSALSLSGIRTKMLDKMALGNSLDFERDYAVHFDLID
jgi:hypothetical protein